MLKDRIFGISLIFTLFFLLGNNIYGQSSESIELKWVSPVSVIDTNGQERKIPFFIDAVSGYSFLPEKVVRIEGYITEFKLTDELSEAVPDSDIQYIKGLSYSDYKIKIRYGLQKGRVISSVYILPLRRNSAGKFERLQKFSYKYTIGTSLPDFLKPQKKKVNQASDNRFRIAGATSQPASSVLSSGSWYKFEVNSTGVHIIDYDLLKESGINPDNIDPRKIRLFGNGGGMLSQLNNDPRPSDLLENSIFVSGEDDGKFDKGDYILFFAVGPHVWKFDEINKSFYHEYNLYSETAAYFLTIGPDNGLRVASKASLPSASQTFTDFDDYFFHEKDEVNILHSGREWFGEKFDYNRSKRNFNFSIPGVVTNTSFEVKASVVSASTVSTYFDLSVNNRSLGSIKVDGISNLISYTYSHKGKQNYGFFSVNSSLLGSVSDYSVGLNYRNGGTSVSTGYLDYIEVKCKRSLRLYGTYTYFRNNSSINAATSEYLVDNVSSDAQIWDVTNPVSPVRVNYSLNGSKAVFRDNSDTLRQYIVFKGKSFNEPVFAGYVPNQNLHGITTPVPDLIIVSADEFVSSAQRLADHRRRFSGLKVNVVTVSQIYNEFSSGSQDISAIRDFVKMVYDRQGSSGDSLKYVLLFGDCSYDYKDRIENNTNFVPIYEARHSFSPVLTYSSDDYYGFMDDYEGLWKEPDTENEIHYLEIGVGRLPVNSTEEAEIAVNKIIHYDESEASRGNWRNEICFVADDGDNNQHQRDADNLSNFVESSYPVFNLRKIYLDAYPQVSAPGGEVSPTAKKLLSQEVEKGVLIVNYTGHGGESGWTQEKILEISDINSLTNYDELTFMITATCEFGRYDDPERPSGAEYAFWNPGGGAIALMTTTRPVYSSSNFKINSALYKNIFKKRANGGWPALGDVMIGTKNGGVESVYNRNYSLLGDPSLTLAYPIDEVKVTSVNDKAPEEDTLSALKKVTIKGEVRTGGSLNPDFNGVLYATVFDKPDEVRTLGNESNSAPMTYKVLENSIYEGKASIKNGQFSFTFIVPKDISYQLGNGKVSLYAKKNNSISDAHGYESEVIIGGSTDSTAIDDTPPSLKAYLNDESFVSGGVTGPNSTLFVNLYDENGINIAGTGIGHEITAVLDNNTKEVIILNDYYTAELDNYQEGTIQFPLKDLEPGNHSIKIKAWDTYNNSSETYIEFVVLNDEEVSIRNVLNYPNPFSTSTNFHFDHNRAGDNLEVLVQIYTVSGKLIKSIQQSFYQSTSHISDLHWNGRDEFGDKIGKGVYIYKLEIRSERDGTKSHKYQKLVILN